MSMNKNSVGKDFLYLWNISNVINVTENKSNSIKYSE